MNALWPHQEFGLAELNRLIAEGNRDPVLACPTGGGKTRMVFDHLVASGVPANVKTDRRMLLSQLGKGMEERGIQFGYRAAGYEKALLRDIQLSMVQTEASWCLNGDTAIHPAEIVYVDEAHKNAGPTMQALREKHREAVPECVFVWVTATPLGLAHVADSMVIAGTNTQLRECGALLPAYHFGPDEPDQKWIGKVAVGEGECGIQNSKRMEFAHRVFGSVVEHYLELNPQYEPTILFAPGVKESIWFAEELNHNGISAAHIDGENVWLDGELKPRTDELIDEIADRHKSGDIKVVCNRFVLREGIDWPWVKHGIFATIFGSLTSYIQAGGRLLRAYPGMDYVTVQDHGGNWWRHGSLNSDREWKLEYTDRIVAGMREQALREKREDEPFACPKCHALRTHGDTCPKCGYRHVGKSRIVMQKDGSLREMRGDIFRQRRVLSPTEAKKQEWCGRVKAVMRSKKENVANATFAQLEVWFARDNNWQYPPRDWPMMPKSEVDWFRPVRDVTELTG